MVLSFSIFMLSGVVVTVLAVECDASVLKVVSLNTKLPLVPENSSPTF